jgi:hypothetical protein
MREIRNEYKTLVWKHEGKKCPGRSRHAREMILKECYVGVWTGSA